MTNHTHLIVAAQDDLTVSIRDFKHYTTTEVKKLLKLDNRHYILRLLEHSYSRKKGSEFQIWQRENYPETITTDKFLVEKVDYLHNNPVVKGYVLKPEWWHYSSAGFYVGQRACPVNLTYVFD
ncbi:hypothetical protein KKD19_01940 [Patescibacteria group bacterium]|nr:hypothetical protein [Patescibacteria group bacterium]MBU4511987.1 hypothetical protein [Patescibacteria group bacterium]MCG2693391.1 hypothetical protein [Candidatus Parcubacteria bacterium]